jgi:hypothetical protein
MMTEQKGYVQLKENIDCTFAMGDEDIWKNKVLRAVEVNEETSSLLLVDSSGTNMGMFNLDDALHVLKCKEMGGVILPDNLNLAEEAMYYLKRINRKGGYPTLIRNMVIMRSLLTGKVDDRFLFQKE